MEICRICGEMKSKNLIPICSFDNSRLIYDLIILILPIKLEVTENMPQKICEQCLKILHLTMNLREVAVKTDLELRNKTYAATATESLLDEKVFGEKSSLQIAQEEAIKSDNDNDFEDSKSYSYVESEQEEVKVQEEPESLKEAKENTKRKGEFKCSDCGKTFKFAINLRKHCYEAHNYGSLSRFKYNVSSVNCTICNKYISHKTNLRRHIIRYHDPDNHIICSVCKYGFKTVQELKDHGEKVHSNPLVPQLGKCNLDLSLISCDLCDLKFSTVKSVQAHMNRKHKKSKNKIPCEYCSRIFTTRSNLFRHLTHTHSEKLPHKCKICNESFRSEGLLNKHLDKIHGEQQQMHHNTLEPSIKEPIDCKFCNEQFSSKYYIERHLVLNHELEVEKVMICDVCNKKFVFFDNLKQHLDHHRRQKLQKSFQFSCDMCPRKYPNEEKLEKHQMSHKENSSLVCHICGKTLNNRFSYEFHVKRHEKQREHACNLCPASFAYIKDLERHIDTHAEIRKYKCPYDGCSKTFKDSYTFNLHKKRHDGTLIKKYACSFEPCEKKFISKFLLDRHHLTHTGEKPHQCQYCEMAYAQKNDLTKHLRFHVGDAIYSCTIDGCTEAFRLQSELKRHYAVHYRE